MRNAAMFSIGAALAAGLLGCQNNKKPTTDPMAANTTTINATVTDVAPIQPTASTYAPAATVTPNPAPDAVFVSAASYQVRKGDTLFSIARKNYGDGKQWQRIATANPGLEPNKLRVGQTIALP